MKIKTHLTYLFALLALVACSQVEPETLEPTAQNLVKNGSFNGASNWSFYADSPMTGRLVTENGMGKLNIQNSDGTPWKAQLYQNVAVQQGERYTLSFKAKATANRPLQVATRNNSNYQDSWNETLNLATSTKTFSYTFTASASNNQQLIFYAGQSGKDVFVDDVNLRSASTGGSPTDPPNTTPTQPANPKPAPTTGSYKENLELIKSASVRNRNHDDSPFINTPLLDLPLDPATSPLFGSRQEYVDNNQTGVAFKNSGSFRTTCGFSHFAYDDPLVYPGQPGASHLHMYFGNTDVNAYSTYDTLKDSGSSTCNGQELNRTGYWVPALFDAQGNVRIPESVLIYYKGENLGYGNSIVYPPGSAMIAKGDKQGNNVSADKGGTLGIGRSGEVNFLCSDARNEVFNPASNTIPDCAQSPLNHQFRRLRMQVKFPVCWNREDPSNPDNWFLPRKFDWYWGDCEERANTPHLQYIIYYRLKLDESTAGWYLASDVDPMTKKVSANPGASNHGDWWGGWHPDINQQWIDNCVNYKSSEPHGCGNGYLSNHGPDVNNPYPGPALKLRPQYDGPDRVAAETLHRELCPQGGELASATAAAYCTPKHMQH